jgi:transglutaminase-like putative cysteine protease
MRLHSWITTAATAALIAPALLAQAPVTQQARDSWLRSDSIYKLAVDSTYKTDRARVLLLDEEVVRLEADGRASRTYHQIVQVLKQSIVEDMSEQEFSWVPDRQTFRMNWIKVLKPDGTVISEAPSQTQDSDVPAARSNPVYGNERVRRLSLSGLAAGTVLDLSFTIDDTAAYPPRDQFVEWYITTTSEVKRSRLSVDVPQGTVPTILETNLPFKRIERAANGRTVYEWITRDVPYTAPEPFEADSNGTDMIVSLVLPRQWKDIGLWYDGLARDRYILGATAKAKVAVVAATARTRDDSIRAVHRLVARDVRYVSVSLGLGGYQPRHPDTVVVTGFGDCKDKATFFVAALRAWGIKAHPVLLSAGGLTEPRLPSARQFDHVIAAVEVGSGYRYVDLTAGSVPYGELPFADQGQFAIVVRADGRVDEVKLPNEPISGNGSITKIVGELTTEGLFNGRYDQTLTGGSAESMRAAFENPLDSTRTAGLVRSLASRVFPGAVGDSLVTFDGSDLAAVPHVGLTVRGGRAATISGGSAILTLPVPTSGDVQPTIARLESQGPRRTPVDAMAVSGGGVSNVEFRVTLPPGWKAQLPQPIDIKTDFGSLRMEYIQRGRELIVRRLRTGAEGVLPPSRAADLLGYFKAIAKDDVKFIVLTTGTPEALPRR